MDILRKELEQIYAMQELGNENLDGQEIEACKQVVNNLIKVTNACYVITDASCDHCYLMGGEFMPLLGIGNAPYNFKDICSSDEDVIYTRLHPEDLVEKRMLEYEYFKFVHQLPAEEKLRYKATCRIRIKDAQGQYRVVNNSTQIMRPSPLGKIWLILCSYNLSPEQTMTSEITPRIVNNHSGEIINLSFSEKKQHVLSDREKEILLLIKEGNPSKKIADILGISIHTVNRHRQNILERLSVGNSVEAITAATAMGLL